MNRFHDQCNANSTMHLHSRRGIVIALASAAVLSSRPVFAAAYGSPEDQQFMRMAIDEARQGDYAFGAVIVRDGQVLARAQSRKNQR